MGAITISGTGISGFAPQFGGSAQLYGALSGGYGLPSITGNFYQVMPGNTTGRFIIQSGYALATSAFRGDNFKSFPYSFPNACVAIVLSEAGAAGWGNQYTCYAVTSFFTAGFFFSGAYGNSTGAYYSNSIGASYMAIGY